jgi:hypothetical protein
MPRQARVDIAGSHYVTNRSEAGEKIFKRDEDKREFLSIVCKSCDRYGAKIHAYVLSDCAYHMIVQTSLPNLSLLMRQISATYSIYYNKTMKKKGSIWHDRFSSWVIKEKEDLHILHKYLANLPKTEQLNKNPIEYKYSYLNTIFSHNEGMSCFEKSIKKKKIENFLKGNIGDQDMEALQCFKRLANNGIKSEANVMQKEPLEKIFKKIKSKEKRDKKIKKAFLSGYTQSEIARYIDLSQSSVSKIVNEPDKA